MMEAAIVGVVVVICVGVIFFLVETHNSNPNMNCAYGNGHNSAQLVELCNTTETTMELTSNYNLQTNSISGSAILRRKTESRQIAKNWATVILNNQSSSISKLDCSPDLLLWSQVEVQVHKDWVLGIILSTHSINTMNNCNTNKYILK